MQSIGTCRTISESSREDCCAEITSDAPEIRASSPRPRPDFCLATGYYLLSECAIGECTRRGGIIVQNGLPEAGCLAQTDVAVDDGLKRLGWEVVTHFAHDITGKPCARVIHRQQYTRNKQFRVQLILHNIHSSQQLA